MDDDEPGQSVKKLTQIPSPHSVVLRSSHHFIKLLPNSFEREMVSHTIAQIKKRRSSSVRRHVAVLTVLELRMYVSIVMMCTFHLTCLQDYLFKTAEALKELHETYERAHLDARVPNICFSEQSPSKDHHQPSTSTMQY